MGNKKYVAYVGTYTHGNSKGIQVYDVDVEKGTLRERSEVQVSKHLIQQSLRMASFCIRSRTKVWQCSDVMRTEI